MRRSNIHVVKQILAYRSASNDGSGQCKKTRHSKPDNDVTRRAISSTLEEMLKLESDRLPSIFSFPEGQNPRLLDMGYRITKRDFNQHVWRSMSVEERIHYLMLVRQCCMEQTRKLEERDLEKFTDEFSLHVLVAAIALIAVKAFNNVDAMFYPNVKAIFEQAFGVYAQMYSDHWFRPAVTKVGDEIHSLISTTGSEIAFGLPAATSTDSAEIKCIHRRTRSVGFVDGARQEVYVAESGPRGPWKATDVLHINGGKYLNVGEPRAQGSHLLVDGVAKDLLDRVGWIPCSDTLRIHGELPSRVSRPTVQ